MQTISILGATGSIGRSALDVIARHPGRFRVAALTASRHVDALAELCARHGAAYACIADTSLAAALKQRLAERGAPAKVLAGAEGLVQGSTLPEADCVIAAIVGAAGLAPTLAAARAGKKLLLANKEALVMAGPIFMDTVRRNGATLLPIDSEHNAVFQSMPHNYAGDMARGAVRRILLTASGGPFRTTPLAALTEVTPEQAVAHPNWVMGRKISVDSATMMNKGLEVIEAHWLFNAPADSIEVVIHPQSVIHSLVDYADGSVLAQLGNPDMRTPIAHALAWPERIDSGVAPLDLFAVAQLNFERPDLARFPCLDLAYRALRAEGNAAAVLNAANEVAVTAFLDRRLPFLGIPDLIAATLDAVPQAAVPDLAAVLEADREGRAAALDILSRMS
ncbi:MAG: 1-deoxy-D-xylulose-5-phosphate reductoisomerase [Sulfuritalea sp.]|nr:1-deoxy-D-xylulose-5-phosphate reductoisomerase [Sulfuritalea sp.]